MWRGCLDRGLIGPAFGIGIGEESKVGNTTTEAGLRALGRLGASPFTAAADTPSTCASQRSDWAPKSRWSGFSFSFSSGAPCCLNDFPRTDDTLQNCPPLGSHNVRTAHDEPGVLSIRSKSEVRP